MKSPSAPVILLQHCEAGTNHAWGLVISASKAVLIGKSWYPTFLSNSFKFNFPTSPQHRISWAWVELNEKALTTDSASSLDPSFTKNLLRLPITVVSASVSASQTSFTTTAQKGLTQDPMSHTFSSPFGELLLIHNPVIHFICQRDLNCASSAQSQDTSASQQGTGQKFTAIKYRELVNYIMSLAEI